MIVLDLLYKLVIGPLELFFEVLYALAFRAVGDPGVAIIFLSLAMNILVLPLYRRADIVQEEQRRRAMAMKPWNDHIKKTFKGDERFMMQQAYNREMGYAPTDALKGSVSLLLEIPFFIAAYHFLSHLPLLSGVSFGPLADLGAPDALLQVGGISINILPILMTAINLASAAVYMKGMPTSNKVQMIGVAAIFLILLYNSPSGLVFYWTLNNLFSLGKNVVYRLQGSSTHQREPRAHRFAIPEATKQTDRMFLFGCVFLTLLFGLLIPSSVIAASPTEFIDARNFVPPLIHIAGALALAVGTFILWCGVFYRLATPRAKTVFCFAVYVISILSVVNYLFFSSGYGNLSPQLEFDAALYIDPVLAGASMCAIVLVVALLALAWTRTPKVLKAGALCLCAAALAIGVANAGFIGGRTSTLESVVAADQEDGKPQVVLSKTGKNVVVLMMDRAVSAYVPYLVHERPEIKEMFDGFTYFPNTISYGAHTNTGAPALYGGAEYRPEQMNARSGEPLVDKHNEALKVLPTIFSENNFDVRVVDPPYAGYTWDPDLSIFDDVPRTKAYYTWGQFDAFSFLEKQNNPNTQGGLDGRTESNGTAGGANQTTAASTLPRTLFCYSLFKGAPLLLQPAIYDEGHYNAPDSLTTQTEQKEEVSADMYRMQTKENGSVGWGIDPYFARAWAVLENLPAITRIDQTGTNQLFMMANDTTHQPTILEEPTYIPNLYVDNTAYDKEHPTRQTDDGRTMAFPQETGHRHASKKMHYQVNMAGFLSLGKWFDYLREQGVWDNTRIIVVSDHARFLHLDPSLLINVGSDAEGDWEADWEGENKLDMLAFNPLLMVKDFNATGFATDESFMTNADVPTLALEGIVEKPVNPFTGNVLDSSYKNEPEQHILFCSEWDTEENNGNVFLPGYWFALRNGNVFDRANWEYLGKH